jgi:signal transduction histidine kinase
MVSDFQADIDAVQAVDAVPRILEVVCNATGMGFAAIARVTEDRWVACAVQDAIDFGLQPGGELAVATTICNEIRTSGEPVIIDHVAEDSVFCGHPTPAMYGFQSYISVPIVLPGGRFFGTLCAIDPRPAMVSTPQTIGMFKLFAELIAFQLDATEKVASTQASLLDERKTAELREQFIAVLGHDLRNPLAAIGAGATILAKAPLDGKAQGIVARIQDSVARMSGMIDNVLDFARGRLGGGIALTRTEKPLKPILRQVIEELQATHPDVAIEADIKLDRPVRCDRSRVGQLFSNLLGNALVYGTPGSPIRVRARTEADSFELSVANSGSPIPPEAMERLFLPFSRGSVRPSQQGLGLGLYIASEIARAHGGTLKAVSTEQETRFTFKMPIGS